MSISVGAAEFYLWPIKFEIHDRHAILLLREKAPGGEMTYSNS